MSNQNIVCTFTLNSKTKQKMNIQINREAKTVSVQRVTILVGEVEFTISVNQFNELVLNKQQYGEGTGDIIIKPSVSNEVRIL